MLLNAEEFKTKIANLINLSNFSLNKNADLKSLTDLLIYNGVFNEDEKVKSAARFLIIKLAESKGIISSSIQGLYEAMGKGEVSGFTVPAINIRGLTYFVARAVFKAAKKISVGPIIFEIARSEIGYTFQRPAEYSMLIYAAALREEFNNLIFIQGDHFQANAKKFSQDAPKEIAALKDLIKEAIAANFYNIDIDTSTLVDLSKENLIEQQRLNFEIAAELTAYIRQLEPPGITISIGGEIGEVGGKNSTVQDLEVFMDNYLKQLKEKYNHSKGISKISVQTGTTHGGIPLPDGSIAKVKLDFETLQNISQVAKEKYGLSGAVQHGASTLPDEAFDKFPQTQTAEVHLATGFQNITYDNNAFPEDLRKEIYNYLKENFAGEKKEGESEEQFIYKTRKKGFGPFKKKLWDLQDNIKDAICKNLEDKFLFLFNKLNVANTLNLLPKFIKPVSVEMEIPELLK